MNVRIWLTAVWFASFVAALGIVESYIGHQDANGKLMLLDEDRPDAMKPVIALFASYLSGLLAFWFLRPLPKAKRPRGEQVRAVLAMACTVLFNAMILYLLCGEHRHRNGNVFEMIHDTILVAGWASLLVGPVNLYYFGMKESATR